MKYPAAIDGVPSLARIGPLELKPLGGVAWARRRQPQRLRATYHQIKGTELRIQPVWTSTEASWLNAIEAHFGELKRATLANTDDLEHAVRRRRIYRYLNYRNRRVGRHDHPLTHIRSVRPIKLERH